MRTTTPIETPLPLEILDIVNHQDEVIGQCRRKDTHQLGLMHRAVHIMVQNDHGQWLLQKRAMHKDTNPGLWDTACAGHVDSGERYNACAVRELREELGLCVSETDLNALFKLPPNEETGNEFVWVYTLCIPSDTPLTIEESEIDAVQWFTAQEMHQLCETNAEHLTDLVRSLWQKIQGEPSGT